MIVANFTAYFTAVRLSIRFICKKGKVRPAKLLLKKKKK